jgi:hypothetical protein
MRILIANFDKQSIVTKEEVMQALLRLPQAHIRKLQAVRYDPWRTIANAMTLAEDIPNSPNVMGTFYHSREFSVIVIFAFTSKAGFLHTLYHEVGHCVFLRTLNQQQRDQWMYRIRKQEAATVSAYARRNAREDFAETYAAWATASTTLNNVPLRARFFREVVFAATS